MKPPTPQRLPRREAIKWMLAATATISMLDIRSFGETAIRAKGYGPDPKLTQFYNPGDLWPLTLDESQRRVTAALCDIIIPADDKSPAASTLNVVDFIDEWVSAPYEYQQSQRAIILDGLSWIEQEAGKRWKKSFANLGEGQKQAICNDICHEPNAAPRFKRAAKFFEVFRNLTSGGFYSTSVGWKDIGYVGNVASMSFDGPPPEVLKHLGLI